MPNEPISAGEASRPVSQLIRTLHLLERHLQLDEADTHSERTSRTSPLSTVRAIAPAIHTATRALPDLNVKSEPSLKIQGSYCEIAFDGKTIGLPALKGLRDLAALFARPGDAVHCLDLAGRVAPGNGVEVLDEMTRRQFRARIVKLVDALVEAESLHDIGRASRSRDEREVVVDTLSNALRLRSRCRCNGNQSERARSAVTRRIRHAIRRLEPAHPALGRHLTRSVHTGNFCVYRPGSVIVWRLLLDDVRRNVLQSVDEVSFFFDALQ